MVVTYVLRVYDEAGAGHDVPLDDGTLGYPHVILLDELGAPVEIANVPPEAPPVGQFPTYDELGALVLVPFTPQNLTGGAVLELVSAVTRTVDFSRRYSLAQFGDAIQVVVQLVEPKAPTVPLDISASTVRQIIFHRPDATPLVVTATLYTDGTDGKLAYQFQAGELNYAGDWEAQGYVVLASGAPFHGRVQTFAVLHNLATS